MTLLGPEGVEGKKWRAGGTVKSPSTMANLSSFAPSGRGQTETSITAEASSLWGGRGNVRFMVEGQYLMWREAGNEATWEPVSGEGDGKLWGGVSQRPHLQKAACTRAVCRKRMTPEEGLGSSRLSTWGLTGRFRFDGGGFLEVKQARQARQ